jgi:hypothetical protein
MSEQRLGSVPANHARQRTLKAEPTGQPSCPLFLPQRHDVDSQMLEAPTNFVCDNGDARVSRQSSDPADRKTQDWILIIE